jgi:hypothetical protein
MKFNTHPEVTSFNSRALREDDKMKTPFQSQSIRSNLNKVLALVSLGIAAVSATGCGSASSGVGNMLQNISVKSYNQNGDLWASMTSQIDTGSMILAGLTIPIVNPHNPSQVYGSFSMQSNLCNPNGICQGGGTLTIAVDLSQISHSQIVDNTLPNGTMIPVGQAASQAIVALPLGNSNGRLYVAFGQGIAMLGVALPFSALNSVGQYVPGVDIFQPFANNGVNGIIGIFAGSAPNTTGIAMFVDLSSLIQSTSTSSVMMASVRSQAVTAEEVPAAAPLILDDVTPSYRDQQNLYYRLWKLNNRHTTLRLN